MEHQHSNQERDSEDKSGIDGRRKFLQHMMEKGVAASFALTSGWWMSSSASVAAATVTEFTSEPQSPVPEENNPQSPSTPSTTTISSQKPFAPLEALLPAARVKRTIDQSVELAQAIQSHPNDLSTNLQRQDQLAFLLLTPGRYMKGSPTTDNALFENDHNKAGFPVLGSKTPPKKYEPAQAYLDTYDRNRQNLPLAFQPGALLVQTGEINAWRRLKRQEAIQESHDELRAALNTYTQALVFRADAYLLTVSSQERSRMVRQDRLPDTKQVIASDMGMRYLYRNQLLTSMANAKAELEYQLREEHANPANQRSILDVSELVPLLREAQSACDAWFGLIDPEQSQAALRVVEQEVFASS